MSDGDQDRDQQSRVEGGAEKAPAPARRPRRRRKEARPGEIVEAGLREFAANGFAATRLEDVAARAGVVKGTIYRYFDNKQALFEAAIKSRIGVALDGIENLIDDFPGPTEELLKLVMMEMHKRCADPDVQTIMGIILSEGRRFPSIIEYYHENMLSKGMTLLGRILRRGVERGEFRDGAAAGFPMAVAAPAVVAAIWRLLYDRLEPIPPERFLEAHLDLITNGLRA